VHDPGAPYRVAALEGVRIASVAAGAGFTLVVTEAGAVYSFGMGDGHLGHGEGGGEDVFLPKRIEALDGIHVASVAAGTWHALALTRCGKVYSWGQGAHHCSLGLGDGSVGSGDEGDGDPLPQLITALLGQRVRAIAAGRFTSCADTDADSLYTWGENKSGNLDHGDKDDRNRPTLVQELHGMRVVRVSMFPEHTLALADDGSVYTFGEGPGLGIRRGSGGGEVHEATSTP
jgi:hypothetical protein